MKNQFKGLLEKFAPGTLDVYRSINNRRHFRRRFKALHQKTRSALFKDGDIAVLSGPFKGMRYFDEVVWGPITPKWLGSYEVELAAIIETIVARAYEVIVDVGCAEGYYAVGLAYRNHHARVHAYDADFISRRQTRRLAALNGLKDRVLVSGYCTAADLERHAGRHGLLVCDIEGFERSLLDPVSCPSLKGFDILVEVHEGAWSKSTLDLLKDRFAASHDVLSVTATDRKDWIRQQPGVSDLLTRSGSEHLFDALNEHRTPEQKWLWLQAKMSKRTSKRVSAVA
jgi:hypothetical protein